MKTELSFGRLLLAYKEELGCTREEMGFILGVSARTFDRWAHEETRPEWALAEEGAITRLQAIVDRRKPTEVIMPKTKWAE